jgi:putative flippase GtrA
MVSLGRSQIASLIASAVDFGALILLVQVGRMWYVAATALGAGLGAFINFLLGRHWSFAAVEQVVRDQALRYAAVAAISLVLNSLTVYLFTAYWNIHYAISRIIAAVLIGLLFNFPLHRRFVFGHRTYA